MIGGGGGVVEAACIGVLKLHAWGGGGGVEAACMGGGVEAACMGGGC